LVAALTLLVGVVGAEVLLRVFHPQPDPYATSKVVVTRNFVPSWHEPHERLRVSAAPGIPGMTTASKTFSTDNVGLRGDSLAMPKPRDEFRVFVVGGSTTECTYLDDSEALPRMIQNRMRARPFDGRRVSVYGAGKSGDNSTDHVAALSHILVHLQPDMIVVFSGINDLSADIAGRSRADLITPHHKVMAFGDMVRFLATESHVMRLAHRVLAPRSERQQLEELPLKVDISPRVAIRRSHPPSNASPRVNTSEYAENLASMVGLARAHGASIVFMTQATTWNSTVDPTAERWHWMTYRHGVTYREEALDRAMERYNDAMRRVAAEQAVPIFDLARLLPKSTRYIYDDVHFNPMGADTASTLLAAFLAHEYGRGKSVLATVPPGRGPARMRATGSGAAAEPR
ncbi:MAG TPA: GDSL-type esterase/lipase family protein, partial [Gemmatimonadaceae bacterium]|nr:GDSL-type esterase/lipase family protein [Gemmatimonadaceae bacterium]